MLAGRCSAVVACFLAAALLRAGQEAPQASAPAPRTTATSAQQSPSIKTQTRLITVDVVASDSRGNPVRDLKASDFQIFEEHGGEQKIAQFRFVDRSVKPPAPVQTAQSPGAPHIYSNQIFERLSVPPTAILVDALSTDPTDQTEARRHMLLLLKTLPPDTPVAVFLLTHTLTLVQTFTADPSQLRNAVESALTTVSQVKNPQNDPDSASNKVLDENGNVQTPSVMALEDFEKMAYEEQTTVAVDETASAMESIAKYLGGYPGRKNLIWFSEAFPLWIAPSADFGDNTDDELSNYTRQTFSGSANYSGRVQAAAEALTDARISVYPVDARGLQASGLYNVDQDPHMDLRNPGRSLSGQMTREDTDRLFSQGSMQEIAQDTGGTTCKNTNDLSGCVMTALEDSSSYYEISYYPENVKWDGTFHKITVKTTQHGVKLRFRRGYFATATAGTGNEKPEEALEQTCAAQLPATRIPLTAAAVAPRDAHGGRPETRYLLTISANAVNLTPAGGVLALKLEVAICEYDRNNTNFQIHTRDLSRPVSESDYRALQSDGIRNIFNFTAKPETQRLRFAVIDMSTGVTGSLDVPAHPRDFVTLVPTGPSTAARGTAFAVPSGPAPSVGEGTALLFTHLKFHAPSGEESTLDPNDKGLSYAGNLGVERGAPAFFYSVYGKGFHCQTGNLVANEPGAGAPNFRFMFRNSAGLTAVIELAGSEPSYSGALPVDATAKAFFNEVWRFCHCQKP
jgi:VWFA-related protein